MIQSETFFRAECDELNCGITIPDGDDASHWPLASVEEALREPREVGPSGIEVGWFHDGDRTLCPRHHPDARPCGTCDGQGVVRVEGPPPNLSEGVAWSLPHHWEACSECEWVGFHPAPTGRTSMGEETR